MWSTGRLWLLRVGLAALLRPKVIAEDWVWMVDHSIQIGQCKCLVILGIRLTDFTIGRPLCHQDMELIDLVPMKNATKQTVAVCLEDAVSKTGVPGAILSDHGADLHGATETFRREHPQTDEFYDIKHKAACLLKARLEKDPRWKQFATLSGQTKFATQQTQLACLVPPSQRTKVRFMNLGELVKWGRQTLALLDDPSPLGAGVVVGASALQAELAARVPRSPGRMVGISRRDRGGLGLRSVPRILPGSGRGPGDRSTHPVGRRCQRVAAAVDRVRDGRVVEGPNRRGSARDDGGA